MYYGSYINRLTLADSGTFSVETDKATVRTYPVQVINKNSVSNYTASLKERWMCVRASTPELDPSPASNPALPATAPATPPTTDSLRRAMSLGTFHLMQTLKNSPAALRRRFGRDRAAESLSHGDPLFKVHYLGTEKIFSLDREQAQDAINRLLLLRQAGGTGTSGGKKPAKEHALVVRPRYVEVKELSTGRQLTKTFLRDIAYCAADATRPNVFLYICKHQGKPQLQCRVFWCSRAERARDMTACLARSFQRALSDWRQQQDGPTAANGNRLGPNPSSWEAGEEQQKGAATEEEDEEEEEEEEMMMPSSPSTVRAKSCTLPASLGK
ncbi:hypothetical protein CRUP_038249, partial [Coryphaenoides rupestris]